MSHFTFSNKYEMFTFPALFLLNKFGFKSSFGCPIRVNMSFIFSLLIIANM